MNVNYRYVEAELRYLFDNADLVALVHDAQFTPRIAATREALPLLRHLIAIDDGSGEDTSRDRFGRLRRCTLAAASPQRDFGERSDDDIYILYTGGTTGMPKGVVWRQEDVLCVLGGLVNFETGIRVKTSGSSPRPPQPRPRDAGLGIVIAPLMHGAAQWGDHQRAHQRPHDGADAEVRRARRVARGGEIPIATLGITGDAMGRPLIEALDEGEYDASSLVAVASTAAVFSATVKEQFHDRFPNLVIADAVGSTETGYNGVRVIMKGGVEKPGLPTVRMGPDTVVLDDDMNIVQPGSGVVGRMARGGNVPLRYHKDPEKSAATFVTVNGRRFALSGDAAVVETDGTMTLLGRGSVCINSGGEKIYPEEVEAALKAHPAVFDVVVVGVPDERWGERVAAVIELRPDHSVTLEELDAHCRLLIAGYKVPREIHRLEDRALAERQTRLPLGEAVATTLPRA